MAHILVTGSADGLGRLTAEALLNERHRVTVHVRHAGRLDAVRDLIDRGAEVVVGDLADAEQTRTVARQAGELGPYDAVIHNAGVYRGPEVMAVNVVAPYLLTALIEPPARLVYLTSGVQDGARAELGRRDWIGDAGRGAYADSKLFVTALAFAVARRWPEVFSNAVNPGWVPTRMGGPHATDDLRLGHLTQEWLATSEDAEALTSGGYWFHQERHPAPRTASDPEFQDRLLAELARVTGETLP